MYDIQQLFTITPAPQATADHPKHFTGLAFTVTSTRHPFFSKEHNGTSALLDFEATAAELVDHGLLEACEVPSKARGHSKHHFNGATFLHAKRMTDGRVSLTISVDLVRQRDVRFMNFMDLALAEFA